MYKWRKCKISRTDQVALTTGEDLKHLSELDPKRWAALAMPTTDLRFDTPTLEFLDADHDGRIRMTDILDAVSWTLERVEDADSLFNPPKSLEDELNEVLQQKDALSHDSSTEADFITTLKRKAEILENEKFLRYRLYLVTLLRNFVNMSDLYDTTRNAIMQTGTLYLDARSFSLCFAVTDEEAHATLSARSECCIIYLKLTRKDIPERHICAVVTAGKVTTLYIGRNGIFRDCDNCIWDAVIERIVETQVSLCEAFWSPWRKLFDTIADQIKKLLNTSQTSILNATTKTLQNTGNTTSLTNSIAALGVGMGMMGAAFAGLIGLIAGLPWWKTASAIVIILLAVSIPSVLLTYFKLRRRNLGAILNASGWAINQPLHFSLTCARSFTQKKGN